MADTPDLSKIVSLIMENPALIEQISALVKKNGGTEEASEASAENSLPEPEASEVASVRVEEPRRDDRSEKRVRLLSAMKPYLSGERAKALDTMMSLSDILGAVRR